MMMFSYRINHVWSGKHIKEVGRVEGEKTKEEYGMKDKVQADFIPFHRDKC